MNTFKEHIIIKLLAVILTATILLPVIVKIGHIFENHKHDLCEDNLTQTHLHELELDCEFYKFQINSTFTFNTPIFQLFSIENNHKISCSQYQFISEYQRLSFALRGPPTLV